MRGIFLILSVGILTLCGRPALLRAQSTIEGSIVNADTGRPLTGINVFLSGTKTGTATDPNGHYRLQHIPAGGYRLVVSSIGYKRIVTEIVVGPAEHRALDFKLTPVVYEMPEIYVGDLDDRWEKHLQRFTRFFIGQTTFADSVFILNPEVLRFDTNWWGRLTAEALAPLRIENRALGYHITYYLDEFNHAGSRTKWDGEPLFTEMTPADSAQARYWRNNRKQAFYGSLRHFLLALLDDHVEEEGFVLYNLRQGVYGYSPSRRRRISAERLLQDADEAYLHHINFFGRLEITYLREEEDWNYIRWIHDPDRIPGRAQTSYLELNERPITVDADGEILEPYGATQFGYFSFERLGDATPREYRPEGFGRQSQATNVHNVN